MINIDYLTLKAFFLENIDFFIGARVQKIRQPTRKDFVFFMRNNSESRKLYVNISPQIYHICFMSEESEKRRNIIMPPKPPMFCMLLRKHLEGCRISDALVRENERIIEFHFNTTDEFSAERSLCLAIELMGKHSNVILYDRETGIIIGCAHNIGEEKNRYRELKGGVRYILPPEPQFINGFVLSDELKKQFSGFSNDKIRKYLSSETFRPAICGSRYTLFSELIEGSAPVESVNSMIDNYYSDCQYLQNLKSEREKLTQVAQSGLQKAKNSISKIETLLKKRDNSERCKLYGELLTANLYQKKDFVDKIELYDYIHKENVVIYPDKTKTMSENAQKYFKLYNKAKATKQKSQEILSKLKQDREYWENVLYSISVSDFEGLEEIKSELNIEENPIPKKKELKPNLLTFNIKGFEVYIGRNNKQNDYIVSKLSRDEDLWFHTRLCAGSHVLLRVRDIEPDESVIYECCKLAAKHSSAGGNSKVGVIYTKRKFLKKPPSAPLGYVTYKGEKEVLV